ncbi:3-oxoacyl-[acyl-carrier-protein] synthase III C-terminal domain-containing protein [Pelagicoccus sp. SDUM812002]|uniref:type III polyketide synthase n=1 Tax=Pelagicoccus sp. SDUM812002 TaxID=3041266 RepID=UPI0028103E4D|nr:3-oxoacyl-[acyl-carrier-protein] synthase III C-terminal domain-containing protein [Pelagicoccus sp. SDUM812002]MDQ8186762.1 3-oxoacyl-[acyl-carrier-protein] synthase III C-terminal domain-containing protein [Pelagicoccus sp. SDUM812002]
MAYPIIEDVNMYLQSLANHVPPTSFRQAEVWNLYRDSKMPQLLRPRSAFIVEKVLTGENGVDKRHFALTDLNELLEMDAQGLNRAFEREAPKLATTALLDALEQASLKPDELDVLIVCTCTGYICPGVASHVAEQAGLRDDAYLLDIVGQGCGAAIPCLRNAAGLIAGDETLRVAVVAVEICSAAFYVDDNPGVLVSACLFGDGASASIWNGKANGGPGWRAFDFDTLHLPEQRQILRFENQGGKLRNRLHRSVPQKVGEAVERLFRRSLERRHDRRVRQVITHTGGRDVLLAIEERLPEYDLSPSKAALRDYGNMSSPSVMFALEAYLKNGDAKGEAPGDLWLSSFGAGFAAHSFRLTCD